MTRAVIYARYSSDLQSDRSIEDQVALCRAYAQREGLEIVALYEDRARSGGTMFGRDGIAAMLAEAGQRRFDVIVVEALDRLSRSMRDLSGIYEDLEFAEVQIRAVHEGEVDEMLIGLRGLFGQYFRKDLKNKIRRGMAGRARDGLAQGGLAYGYAVVPGSPGARAICQTEAAIVTRIFREYADGRTPREIACGLNADGIPAPAGGAWNASTINGNGKRGVGILRNELYAGRMVWGRTRKVVAPSTGQQLIRPNAPDSAVAAEVPALAIVPRELFEAAASRKRAMATVHPGAQKGRKHLLSGLLRCGGCGAGLYVHAANKHGHRRLACSRQRESGDCAQPHTFMLPTIERAVLSGLQSELRQPAAIAEFLRVYTEERRRLSASSGQRRREIERELAQTERRLARLVECIAEGHGDAAVLGPQSTETHRRIQAMRAELEAIGARSEVVCLHPAAVDRYRDHVEHLAEFLAGDERHARGKAAAAIRSLIETVTVWRGDKHGQVRVQIRGRLAALVAGGEEIYPNGVWGKVERVNRIRQSPHLTGACFLIEAAA